MISELEKSTSKAVPSGKKRGRPKKTVVPEDRLTKPYLVIDHPKNRENIGAPHHYAIRIGAEGGEIVEISINNGTWHACRHAAGYFWYDWHSIPKGTHKIVARMKLLDGKYKKSKITRCTVNSPPSVGRN